MNHPKVAAWLNAVSGWSPLQVAAGCRLYKDAAVALRQGRIDPDDPATTSVKDIMKVIATTKAGPAAMLPWGGRRRLEARPVCKHTAKLVAAAVRGWHRTTHWLHHRKVRKVVFTVLGVAGRLEAKDALPLPPPKPPRRTTRAAAAEAEAVAVLPVIPIEMWFYAMSFIKRSWWKVSE